MCQVDCIDKWLTISLKQREIEQQLEDKLKDVSDLSLNEFYVLYFLSQEPNLSMRTYELQEKVQLTQSAMSRLISRMEKKENGGISRGNCANDKRGVCIKLTQEGQKLVEKFADHIGTILVDHQSFLNKF